MTTGSLKTDYLVVGAGAMGMAFTDALIDSYIALKRQDVDRLRMTPHPVEFDMYYSV